MKTTNNLRNIVLFLPVTLLCMGLSCSKNEKEDDMVPDQIQEHSYIGTLTVKNTNTYPEWDETAQVDVTIDKEMGLVTFGHTTLTYSGETIINNDAKIERSGSWTIDPTGRLEQDGDVVYVQVDAGVSVVNDIQKIYAKNNQGNWQLVNQTSFDSTPNSDLSFKLDDAVINGSVISADSGIASLTWTLRLSVALD